MHGFVLTPDLYDLEFKKNQEKGRGTRALGGIERPTGKRRHEKKNPLVFS